MKSPGRIGYIRQRAALFLQLVKARKQGQIRPVVSNLFLTTRCNGVCNYCYTDKTIGTSQELSTSQWKSVIDDLHHLGCRMVNLMGGEPLLRSDFPEILEHAIGKNIVCDVNTNCFLVPKHIEKLKAASQIFTSVDGDEAAHDLNRGSGSFRKTIAGIEAATNAGIPVRINCTVTRANVGKIDYLIGLAERFDSFLTFTPLIRIRENLLEKAAHLQMSEQEARQAFADIKQAKSQTNRIMNSDASLDFFINYPVELGCIVRRDETGPAADYYSHPCPYGRLQHFVVSNGDVFPCHNMWNEPSFTPMNVLTDGTAEAVENASRLWCKYCWLANLVEWNEFTSFSWLAKGAYMTLKQIRMRSR